MKVKVINKSGNPLPAYATALSAGLDVRAANAEPIELKPLSRAIVPTGLFLEIPAGYEVQVRPRSGLAAKRGITVLNAPGTIDADYRGEVCVILVNLGLLSLSAGSASPSWCWRGTRSSNGKKRPNWLILRAERAVSAVPASNSLTWKNFMQNIAPAAAA